jgi:hypothetical protein
MLLSTKGYVLKDNFFCHPVSGDGDSRRLNGSQIAQAAKNKETNKSIHVCILIKRIFPIEFNVKLKAIFTKYKSSF